MSGLIKNPRVGLGDVAYWAFRPAVYVVDIVWGTDLRDCDRCKERRRDWNANFSLPWWAAILVVTIVAGLIVWRRA